MNKRNIFYIIFGILVIVIVELILEGINMDREIANIQQQEGKLDGQAQQRESEKLSQMKESFAQIEKEYNEWRDKKITIWGERIESLRAGAEDAFTQVKFIQHWKDGTMDQLIPRLIRYNTQGANAIPEGQKSYLDEFVLSGNSIRFDYHNTLETDIQPDFKIEFFDKNGRLLGEQKISWVFQRLYPGDYDSEVKNLSLPQMPYYYKLY